MTVTGGPAHPTASPPNAVDAAWGALATVYDPELGLDLVSLGLVYDVHEEAGKVVVTMTLTTPGCPAAESLPEIAEAAVRSAVGPGGDAEVHLVWDPPWSPRMMTEEAIDALGVRRR